MKKKCVCVLLSAAMAMTMFAGCGNKDQASEGETNTVASADAEKSSETEGAEVNADESSGADMSATEAAEETSEAAETTAAEPFEATTVTVFAAKSLNTVMEELIAEYNKTQPNVSIVGSYDSSGTLMTQIEVEQPVMYSFPQHRNRWISFRMRTDWLLTEPDTTL